MGLLEIVRGLVALLFFQTSWSYKGRQGLGLKCALLITARTKEQRTRIMDDCHGSLNTNPFAAGAVVGAIERAEYDAQELRTTDRFTDLAQRVLAAGGDRLFWHTLRPTLTALAVFLGLNNSPFAPLSFLIVFVAVSQGTRVVGLRLGYTRGRDCVPYLQARFDRWIRSLELFAPIVVGMLTAKAVLGTPSFAFTVDRVAMLPLAAIAYFALRRNLSPTLLLLLFFLIFGVLRILL